MGAIMQTEALIASGDIPTASSRPPRKRPCRSSCGSRNAACRQSPAGKPGGGQQQLGALNAYIFDIVCQAGVHLPLEFSLSGSIRRSQALGQLVDGISSLGVQLNSTRAVLYLLGHLRVGAAAVYPVYKSAPIVLESSPSSVLCRRASATR